MSWNGNVLAAVAALLDDIEIAAGLEGHFLYQCLGFIDPELSGASTRVKKAINSVPYEPFPYTSEQGIFFGALLGN